MAKALVNTFCESGTVPRIPRSNGRCMWHEKREMGLGKRRRRDENQHVWSRFYVLVLKALKKLLHLIIITSLGGSRDFKNKGTGV